MNRTVNFHPGYRPDIDGMRALAILAVVFYHAFPGKLTGGFAGVDVFFVISGYLISTVIFRSLEQGRFSFREFFARRIKRLSPALILVLASCYLFGSYALLSDEFQQLAKHTAFSAAYLQNFALWGEAGYFDTANNLKPLMHLWSLGVEEQFYLVFPLLFWAAWRLRLNMLALLLAVALASFGLNMAMIQDKPVATFYLPLTRFWELLAGALLAYLYRADPQRSLGQVAGNAMTSAGLLLLVACFALLDPASAYPGWRALVPVAATVMLIAAGPQTYLNRWLLGNRPMRFIGAISYPLYLWHWPLLAFSLIIDEQPVTQRNAAVVLSFVLAWLTWCLVERPVRFGPSRRYMVPALCGMLLVLVGLGLRPLEVGREALLRADHRHGINRFDHPYKQDCAAVLGSSGDNDWCNAGNANGAAPQMLLAGDSFSNAYTEMLKAVPGAPRFVQAGRGGCPALAGYGNAECRAFTNKVLALAENTPELATVVLAGHWPAYVDRREMGMSATADEFFQAFEATVARYQAMGKRVVVLLSPPTGSKPRACLGRPISLSKKRMCDLPQTLAMENDGAYRERMLPFLESKGVPAFDPFRALCDGTKCQAIDGDKILYADINHLSVYGGQYLAQYQADALRSLLLTAD